MILVLAILAATLLVIATLAGLASGAGEGIAKLRVYPQGDTGDPGVDESYVLEDPDPWVTDSWVITVSGDFASFGLNITNRHDVQAYDIVLRIAVNDSSLVNSISLEVTQGDVVGSSLTLGSSDFVVGVPSLTNGKQWPRHGVYPTPYANFSVGGAGPLGSLNDTIVVAVEVDGLFTEGLKVHFDADGWTILENQGKSPILSEQNDTNVRNPNSADTTVQIPTFLDAAVPILITMVVILLINRRWKRQDKG